MSRLCRFLWQSAECFPVSRWLRCTRPHPRWTRCRPTMHFQRHHPASRQVAFGSWLIMADVDKCSSMLIDVVPIKKTSKRKDVDGNYLTEYMYNIYIYVYINSRLESDWSWMKTEGWMLSGSLGSALPRFLEKTPEVAWAGRISKHAAITVGRSCREAREAPPFRRFV